MPWDFAAILVVLATLVPWRGAVRVKQLLAQHHLGTADRLTLYASTVAFQWLAVAVVAWRWHAHGLTAQRLGLGLPEPQLAIGVGLGLALLLGGAQLFSLLHLARFPSARQGFLHQMAQKILPHNLVESLAFLALVLTAALCEELLYRGFALSALEDATNGSVAVASLASSALFALAHIYQGRRGLVITFLVGLTFAASRILTASLAPSIVAHLLTDLLAGLAAPRLLATSRPFDQVQPPAPGPPPGHNAPTGRGH